MMKSLAFSFLLTIILPSPCAAIETGIEERKTKLRSVMNRINQVKDEAETSSHCLDDVSYRYRFEGNDWKCSDVNKFHSFHKQDICSSSEVIRNCPKSCGTCCEVSCHTQIKIQPDNFNSLLICIDLG